MKYRLFPIRRLTAMIPVMAGLLASMSLAIAASTPEEPEEIVQTFLKCWETGDAETFASLLSEDARFAYPGDILDKEGLLETFKELHTRKKDIRIYFWDTFISQDNRHVTAYEFAATDRDSGKRTAVGTGVYCIIEDGKITDFREFWDSGVPLMQKKGELPLDEGGEITPWPETIWLRPDTID